MKLAEIDGCACPEKLLAELQAIKQGGGVVYNSIYRGDDAAEILHRNGKHTQREVYQLSQIGAAGYGPANPPGFSTHECRNDGAAYSMWPRGARIPYWAVGIDTNQPSVVCARARNRGWTVTSTYPNSVGERQHVNFRKKPILGRLVPTLKRGSEGEAVAQLVRQLERLGFWDYDEVDVFDARVERAVKKFQTKTHQKPDGIVGASTRRQLKVSLREHKQGKEDA